MKVFYLTNGINIACDNSSYHSNSIVCTNCAKFLNDKDSYDIDMCKHITINPNHVVYTETVECSVEDFVIAYGSQGQDADGDINEGKIGENFTELNVEIDASDGVDANNDEVTTDYDEALSMQLGKIGLANKVIEAIEDNVGKIENIDFTTNPLDNCCDVELEIEYNGKYIGIFKIDLKK